MASADRGSLHHEECMTVPRLLKGERILWSARPKRGLFFRTEWLAVIPILGVGCWMSSVVFSASRSSGEWPPFMLLGLVSAAFVIGVAANLVGLDLFSALKAEYHLTDKRVIVATRVVASLERSVPLSELGEVGLRERSNGSGSVTFRPKMSWADRLRPPAYFELLWFPRLAFDNIAAARDVYNLVLQAMADQVQQRGAA
jgi:hypothetical protein